ncbi:MAG: reverse transcriptase/maturase family protein [Verrucomicrobiota bacterium]
MAKSQRYWQHYCTLERVASLDNLWLAAVKARQGKTRRPDVEAWWLRREGELARLHEELLAGTYEPGGYRFFEIHDPKRRLIAAAPFRDRVVHHALCNLLAPVLERTFIARSYSCQIGKGTTAARECCRQLTNRYRYVLKCDVRKFFPNLDHAVLYARLAARVACPGVLALIGKIMDSYHTGTELPPPLFPGEDMLAAAERPRGLPIGNLTSQLWGNFYLDDLDHWVTEQQRHGAYLRYTDDFLLFGDDPARLWDLREMIREQLARVRLKLAEPKSRLLATREGVPFCGFRFLPGLRPRILGATKRRFERRRQSQYREGDMRALSAGVFAWYQFSREGNAEGLRRAYAQWPLDARWRGLKCGMRNPRIRIADCGLRNGREAVWRRGSFIQKQGRDALAPHSGAAPSPVFPVVAPRAPRDRPATRCQSFRIEGIQTAAGLSGAIKSLKLLLKATGTLACYPCLCGAGRVPGDG